MIYQTSLARFDPAIISDLVVQPLHSLFQKSLHPLVDKAAADANCPRNISDRHPLSEEQHNAATSGKTSRDGRGTLPRQERLALRRRELHRESGFPSTRHTQS